MGGKRKKSFNRNRFASRKKSKEKEEKKKSRFPRTSSDFKREGKRGKKKERLTNILPWGLKTTSPGEGRARRKGWKKRKGLILPRRLTILSATIRLTKGGKKKKKREVANRNTCKP